MIEPKRLADEEGTDLERLLLDAARRERPTSSLVSRMLAGLGPDGQLADRARRFLQ